MMGKSLLDAMLEEAAEICKIGAVTLPQSVLVAKTACM